MAAAQPQPGGVPALPRVAALLAVAFVAVVWGGVLLKQRFPQIQNALGQGMGSTGLAFIGPVALVAAVGLWLRKPWGWWFSLIVVLVSGDATGLLTFYNRIYGMALLVVILLPGTRRACLSN